MFSEPAVGEAFFGREEILELLDKRVSALREGYRQNVALTGQSLAGKSSIIHHFLYNIREEDLIPVYVEVVKEPFKSFANKYVATLLYHSLIKIGEPPGINLETMFEKAQRRLPKTYAAIRHILSTIDKEQHDEAYSNLLGLTSVLKDEIKMSCVVILDEFDNLEHLGVKNPFLSFGKVIMVQKDTMYIVSSSRNEAIKKILSEKLSLLFGNFEIVKISGFSFKTASDFLGTRLAGYDIDEAMKRFLIAFTDGNVFYLNKLAAALKEAANEKMTNYIDSDVIAGSILDLVYNSNGVIHQYLMNYLLDLLDTKYRESYISILVSIANLRNKQSEISRASKIKKSELSKHLLRLVELGLISKNGIFYKIDDAMLEFWLKFVYQRRKELLVDGLFNKARLFAEDIKSYIISFTEELEKGLVPKITELFNRFSNDLVSIDSKSLRLPHFTKVEVKHFPDAKPFIAASTRGNFWIANIYEYYVGENDIIDYIRNLKTLGYKISNKIIIPVRGMDENAKLLAKELKMSIWDLHSVNMLLGLYGKKGIVAL